MHLHCPTHDDNEKALTVDALKEEILINKNWRCIFMGWWRSRGETRRRGGREVGR